LEILKSISKGVSIKDSYMKIYAPDLETEESFITNREHMVEYLRAIFVGIVLFQ
jgi:hypothetical protein